MWKHLTKQNYSEHYLFTEALRLLINTGWAINVGVLVHINSFPLAPDTFGSLQATLGTEKLRF